MAAILCLISLSPGVLGGSPALGSLWRLGQILLLSAIFIRYGAFTFDKSLFRFFGLWLSALGVLCIINYHSPDIYVIFVKNTITIIMVGLLTTGVDVRRWDPKDLGAFFLVLLFGTCALATQATLPAFRSGWSWDAARLAKLDAFESGTLPLNISVFIVAICIVSIQWRSGIIRLAYWGYFLLLGVVSATRTPVVAAIGSLLGVGAWNTVSPRLTPSRKRFLARSAALVLVVAPFLWVAHIIRQPDPDLVRSMAGRPALWQAAVQQWLTSPIFGNFDMPFIDALNAAYPQWLFNEKWEAEALYELTSGGFHSIWMQTLAIYGIFGFLVVLVSYYRLIAASLIEPYCTEFACVVFLLFFRSFTEYSGLFAYSNDVLDFICCLSLAYSYKLGVRRRAMMLAGVIPTR